VDKGPATAVDCTCLLTCWEPAGVSQDAHTQTQISTQTWTQTHRETQTYSPPPTHTAHTLTYFCRHTLIDSVSYFYFFFSCSPSLSLSSFLSFGLSFCLSLSLSLSLSHTHTLSLSLPASLSFSPPFPLPLLISGQGIGAKWGGAEVKAFISGIYADNMRHDSPLWNLYVRPATSTSIDFSSCGHAYLRRCVAHLHVYTSMSLCTFTYV